MPLAEMRGGVEVMLLRLLHANRNGPNVSYHVAFLEDGPMVSQVASLGYPVAVFPSGRLRQLHRYIRTVRKLSRWFVDEGVSIASCWTEKGQIYGAPAARLAKIPSTWFLHNIPAGHWMNRLATLMPAASIFCCGETARKTQAKIWPKRHTQTVYISVDLEQFSLRDLPTPEIARQRLNLPASIPIVGIVARLQRWKGVHVFLEAASHIAKRHCDAYFVIVGGEHWAEKDYPELLVAQATKSGLGDRVLFAGLQSDVPLWMQSMDVVVHASFDEPTGTVILEAMALGKAVVCAKTEGPSEFLTDGVHGLSVLPGDAGVLASAIERFITDVAFREACGSRASMRAREFGTDRLALSMREGLVQVLHHVDPRSAISDEQSVCVPEQLA